MKSSRLAIYFFIALLCCTVAGIILVMEPEPHHPTNLIHLIVRH